jgi:hypothetical protein
MKNPDIASWAKRIGIPSVPAVVMNGMLADCCTGRGPDEATLRTAGLGQPIRTLGPTWRGKTGNRGGFRMKSMLAVSVLLTAVLPIGPTARTLRYDLIGESGHSQHDRFSFRSWHCSDKISQHPVCSLLFSRQTLRVLTIVGNFPSPGYETAYAQSGVITSLSSMV